jgi:glucosamine--fructose-6-phosphate aminotransferase (isomerizing)
MAQEIQEQPEAVARLVDREVPRVWALAERWRRRPPRFIVMVARGTSDHAALYGKYLFEIHTGRFVGLGAPSVASIYQASVDLRDALVIGISQSGQAADVIAALEGAKAAGAETLAITNVGDSPMTRVADETLELHANPECAVAATKTFTNSLAALLILAAAMADDAALREECLRLPQLLADTLALTQDLPELAQRFRYLDDCVALGRGYNLAIAYEFALKLRETAYVRVQPFASPDFVHGPIAILDDRYPVIAFANDGPALPSLLEVLAKVRGRGAETIVIGNAASAWTDADLALPLRLSRPIPEVISPFPCALVAQQLAHAIACAKGYDPDQPRGLQKVTITR